MDTKLKIIFTNHALSMMENFNIPFKKAIWMLQTATQETPPDIEYKFEKYGESQKDISFWRHGTCIFTVKNEIHRKTGEPIVLVITITDQRVTIGGRKQFRNSR